MNTKKPRKLYNNVEFVAGGLDWLTATTDDTAAKIEMLRVYDKLNAIERRLGQNQKKGSFQGYAGFATGAVFWGRLGERDLLRVSSSLAGQAILLMPASGIHYTRMDVQVTVRLPEYDATIAQELAARRIESNDNGECDLKTSQKLILGYGKGDSLLIGSRTSPRYGRIYDKQKEAGTETYARCWRFEVEYKKMMADKVAQAFRTATDPAQLAKNICAGQFQEWNIEVPVQAEALLIEGSIGRRTFDSDRILMWLRTQVAPSIEKLKASVSDEDILEALGIEGPIFQPAPRRKPKPPIADVAEEWLRATSQKPPQ